MIKRPKACIFDAFGTLFNLDIPLQEINEKAEGKGKELLQIWRSKQLEYTWLRTLMNNYAPFSTVTREALTFAMNSLSLKDEALYDILMPIYSQATAFEEVLPCLKRLKEQGVTTAILSNGTLEMLEAGAKNSNVYPHLDAIISVDSIGIYKPAPQVYQFALDSLNLKKEEVLFLSSNQWDIAGATQFGLATVWINKHQDTQEVLPPRTTYQISSLVDFSV